MVKFLDINIGLEKMQRWQDCDFVSALIIMNK